MNTRQRRKRLSEKGRGAEIKRISYRRSIKHYRSYELIGTPSKGVEKTEGGTVQCEGGERRGIPESVAIRRDS